MTAMWTLHAYPFCDWFSVCQSFITSALRRTEANQLLQQHMLLFEEMVDCLTWVAPVSFLLRKLKVQYFI